MKLNVFSRFLIVGFSTVAVDAIAYALLIFLGVDTVMSKILGFLCGAVFAYFANWRFTFGKRRSQYSEVLFVCVYAASLAINVALNEGILALLGQSQLSFIVAFLFATAVSAGSNFMGMSLFVFKNSVDAPVAPREEKI